MLILRQIDSNNESLFNQDLTEISFKFYLLLSIISFNCAINFLKN